MNPVNRSVQVSLQETQENVVLLSYDFRKFLRTFPPSLLYPWGQGNWPLSFSLLRKTSKFEDYGRQNKNRTEIAPWRTKLIKEFLSIDAKNPVNLHSWRKQSLVIPVNICYKYRAAYLLINDYLSGVL